MFDENEDDINAVFGEFLVQQQNCIWVAHNGSRFHTVFLLKFLIETKNIILKTSTKGAKIISLLMLTVICFSE